MALSEPGYAERDRQIQKLCWAVAISLLITHAVLAWITRAPAVTPAANDDAQYLLLARSLQSLHYVDLHIPGSPVHSQYPPVYPAALAITGGLFGNNLQVAQATTILFSVLALLLIFDIARRLAGPVLGVLVLAPLAVNINLIGFAGRIVTEAPYMAFSFATIWALSVLPESRRQYLLAGALAILAALTRSIGVSVVAGVLAYWLLNRRFKVAALFTVAAAATVGGWLLWTVVSPTQFTERSYTAVATTTSRHFSGPVGMILTRAEKFFDTYVLHSLGTGLRVPTLDGTAIDNVAWAILIAGLGVVGFFALRKKGMAIPLYFLAYCGILMLYPYKMTRFFMPVVPVLLVAMFVGLRSLLGRRSERATLIAGLAISVLLLISNVPDAIGFAHTAEKCDRQHATVSRSCFAADRLAFFEAARYAKATLPPDAIVVTIKEATFFYYTGRRVIHPDLVTLRGRKNVLAYLEKNRIQYALVSAFTGGAEVIRPLLSDCERVEVIRDFGTRTVLLRIRRPGEPGSGACATFQSLVADIQSEATDSTVD